MEIKIPTQYPLMKSFLIFAVFLKLFSIGYLFSHEIYDEEYKKKFYEVECPEIALEDLEDRCVYYELEKMESFREAEKLKENSQDYKNFVEAFGDFVIEEDYALVQGRIIEIATYNGSNYKDIWAINDRYLKNFNNFCEDNFWHHEMSSRASYANFGINLPYTHCKHYQVKISKMTPVAPNHDNAIAIIKEKNLKEREYNQKLKEIKNEVKNLKNELKNSNKVQYEQVCSKKTVNRKNINTGKKTKDIYHICEMVRVKTKEERIGDGIGYMIGKILNN